MNRRLSVIAAILRKDWLMLWPLAALAAVLRLMQIAYFDIDNMYQDALGLLAVIHQVAIFIAVGLLIVAAIQNDALTSVRHDSLTRPIARLDLAIAKLLCIVLLLAIPAIVIDTAIFSWRFGFSFGESFARASAAREMVFFALIIAVIATLTTTVLQALSLAIGAIVVSSVLMGPAMQRSGMREDYFASGAQWITGYGYLFAILAIGCLILWLQYKHRMTNLARGIFAGTVLVLSGSIVAFSWAPIFAVQKAQSVEPSVAETVKLDLEVGCFSSLTVEPMTSPSIQLALTESAPLESRKLNWTTQQLQTAGPGAIEFATPVIPSGVGDGWKLIIGRVQASYIGTDGTRAEPVAWRMLARWSGTNGTGTAQHLWLLPRAEYNRLSADPSVRLQIDYSMSLLKRKSLVDVPVGGGRHYFPELGYCGAEADLRSATIKVDCFKRGFQPALVTAAIDGGSATTVPIGFVDYTPASLEFLASKQYKVVLRTASPTASHVRLVTYEDRAHFSRVVTSPGVLGGPVSQCSAPPAK